MLLNGGEEALAGSILAFSEHLKLDVVADGVETAEQLEMLEKYNCQCFQGYYFSKPLAADKMTEYLKGN